MCCCRAVRVILCFLVSIEQINCISCLCVCVGFPANVYVSIGLSAILDRRLECCRHKSSYLLLFRKVTYYLNEIIHGLWFRLNVDDEPGPAKCQRVWKFGTALGDLIERYA